MRAGAFQFDVRGENPRANLERVEQGLTRAADEGIDLVVLPEMWPTSFVAADDEALARTDEALARVTELTGRLGLVVCGSAFGRAEGETLPRNRLHVLAGGRCALSYDKVHLFSPTAERESFSAGDAPPATVDTAAGRLSGVVCYDLRFEPLLQVPFRAGAEALLVPAQWPAARASHWRALVVGRAVESQCFVVAANRTGVGRIGRRRLELEFHGNSLVVDPHGRVLAEGHGAEGLVQADLDLAEARRLRVRVPVSRDRRPDLYRRWSS